MPTIVQPEHFQVYEIEFDRATWERVKATVVALNPNDARYRAMAGKIADEEIIAETLIQNHALQSAPVRHLRPANQEERPKGLTYEQIFPPKRE